MSVSRLERNLREKSWGVEFCLGCVVRFRASLHARVAGSEPADSPEGWTPNRGVKADLEVFSEQRFVFL